MEVALAVLLVVALLALLVWWLLQRRPKATPYGKPANTTDAMWWFWQQLQAMEPSSALGGTFANKPGYHNCRNNLPSYDYSVCDRPPDDGGPGNVCGAIDWTFYDAQRGDYSTISKYTKRLIDSGRDPDDPRMNGWREVYGNADSDTYVEGWDFRYGYAVSSDASHLWHIHLSESRDMAESYDNKKACLSVLRGESVEQWLRKARGDGAVLLNCPYDDDRLDLLYVGPDGGVMHRWWWDGIDTAWGTNTKNENLGGSVHVGTLTAAWDAEGDSINIAALGAGDASTPAGCGQYWSMNLNRSGARSGWGSMVGAYGRLPTSAGPDVEAKSHQDRTVMVLALVAVIAAVVALAYVLTNV